MNLNNSSGGWSPNRSAIGIFKSSIKVRIHLFFGAPNVLDPFLNNLETNMDKNFPEVV